jgi:hypothetical protein
MRWPVHFERQSRNAPLTHREFGVNQRHWQVLIDARGQIRAVGLAADRAFQCALRAAVAETRGEVAYIPPRTLDGKTAAESATTAKPTGKKGPATRPVAEDAQPADDNSESLHGRS